MLLLLLLLFLTVTAAACTFSGDSGGREAAAIAAATAAAAAQAEVATFFTYSSKTHTYVPFSPINRNQGFQHIDRYGPHASTAGGNAEEGRESMPPAKIVPLGRWRGRGEITRRGERLGW